MVDLRIPTDVWVLAIAIGHLQAAWIETSNPLVFSQILKMRYHLNMFLKAHEAEQYGN